MQTIKLLILIVALFGSSYCSPIGVELFPGFYRNANLQAPEKEAEINKRLAVVPNPDAALKQISLQAFIGNLEQSLLQSAISVSGVNDHTQQVVPEVTPIATVTSEETSGTTTESDLTTSESSSAVNSEHTISKRSTNAQILDGTTTSAVTPSSTTTEAASTTTTTATPTPTPSSTAKTIEVSSSTEGNQVLLQTTKKVPQQNGIPSHILIDRISVQPHSGHIPLIPTFQVQHTKVVTVRDDNATPNTNDDKTQISITQTSFKTIKVQSSKDEQAATTNANAVPETTTVLDSAEESTAASTTQAADSASTTITSPTTGGITTEAPYTAQESTTGAGSTSTLTSSAASATTTTSTAKPLEELKHAEEDLKEKVAEIEAEPVILSARV